jgi:hypothetical protein
MSRNIELTCAIDIEQTAESFHAHAIPDGVEINPGDMILVHDAPSDIGFGESYTGERRATLMRANPLVRLWTELTSIFEITELYEVGFQPIADAPGLKG